MLLIFGLKTTYRLVATRPRTCPHCGQHTSHQVVETANKLSVFFIPLFRVGAARYLDLCPVCGLETRISQAEAQSPAPDVVSPQDAPAPTPQDRR